MVVAVVLGMIAGGLAVAGVPVAPLVAGGIAVVVAVLALVVPPARYRRWGYRVRAHDLVLGFGVVVRTERWVPRTRVQHVDVIGGPVERLLGLRHVVIHTAGTRESAIAIPGLKADAAEALRADLLAWSTSP
jgi:membrane protein YdbS with pleckstrin-like domain